MKGVKIKWKKAPNSEKLICGKIAGWTRFIIDLDDDGRVECLRDFLDEPPVRHTRPGSLLKTKHKAQELLHQEICRLEELIVSLSTQTPITHLKDDE